MTLWDKAFAALYDPVMARSERAGLTALRRELLAQAAGRVLEIGGGTGVNLGLYPDAVTELVVTEPEEPMATRLRRRVAAHRATVANVEVVPAPAERLPFPDASFDCAVSTLVLCTVSDLGAALGELRRVLRPGGRLLFLEHVRSPDDPGLARWQERLAGPWRVIGHGCNPARDTGAALADAGFEIVSLEHGSLPKALPIVRPLIQGVAVRPA
jgi:ubiquinone/menaquinone biosynthesis C-methylase UbiE